jgi:hypothetical protein
MDNANELLGKKPEEWFSEAARWYLEGHQGCPCCRQQHCVFRSQWGWRIEYYCTACDFSVSLDVQSKQCTASRGDGVPSRLKLGRDSGFDLPSPLTR